MQALKDRHQHQAHPAAEPACLDRLREHAASFVVDAMSHVAPTRVAETAREWLARAGLPSGSPAREAGLTAEALAMAMNLALFTPSGSGSIAFDRLARQRGRLGAEQATALAALRQAQFRLLRLEAAGYDGVARLRDLASGEVLQVADERLRADLAGLSLVGWLARLADGWHVFAGGVTPLDAVGLAVATGFLRPSRPGLVNPLRCAEAVYRHVLRHGTPEIPGLNRPLPAEEDGQAEGASDLDLLAVQWAEPGAERDGDDVQFVRSQTDLDTVIAMLASAAHTLQHGLGALSNAYAAIAQIQLETIHRRASAGSGSLRLERVAAALEAGVAAGELSPGTRDVFRAVRHRLGVGTWAQSGRDGKDAELDRLIGRIQALRAKTVEQGCTEHEALAAAEKVAELLDRYGLSLSELDLRGQRCEGSAVETERKRTGPIDDCVPSAAAFFDCRVWGEKSATGTLRYVFFGLPADVAAARFLYDLVAQAFETETARFRGSETYATMPTGVRRTATNSFQIGLARGIVAKLHCLREARETMLRGASGRDLVLAKADIVETELSTLGLHLRGRSRSGGRRVLRDAFQQGHAAGLDFQYTPGVSCG